MKSVILFFTSLLTNFVSALPLSDIPEAPVSPELPRLIIYFQTTHDSQGRPISLLPLIHEKGIALTHVIVCSLHINKGSEIHLNDNPPGDPRFNTLWEESKTLKDAGVKIMGMIGGAAPGSFDTGSLDSPDASVFEHYYGQLRDVIQTFELQGMDLDVEQSMSQSGIARLVERLRADFGAAFLTTLAPVATDLTGGGGLSGFDYKTLEADQGGNVAWYNTQFYNGWGTASSTQGFDQAVGNGFRADRVVVGQVTSPDDGGGWTPFETLNSTVAQLRSRYGQIGGVMGWEYFNARPNGTAEPWAWAQEMTRILRPDGVPSLRITRQIAEELIAAWQSSVIQSGARLGDGEVVPNVDYMAMVNA